MQFQVTTIHWDPDDYGRIEYTSKCWIDDPYSIEEAIPHYGAGADRIASKQSYWVRCYLKFEGKHAFRIPSTMTPAIVALSTEPELGSRMYR